MQYSQIRIEIRHWYAMGFYIVNEFRYLEKGF